jgi:steroid delta-isomerase-like uncharacterized protein
MGGARLAQRRRRRQRAAGAVAAVVALGTVGVLLRRRMTHDERRTMSDSNKGTSQRVLEEAFNQGNLDVLDDAMTADVIDHDSAMPEDIVGIPRVKEAVSGYRVAFPDLRVTIDQQLGEGDLVATRWTARGTNEGELMGIAPTGKQATVTGITIDRYEGGKIAETWTNWDTLGLLQQLGAIPTPAQA